MPSSSARWRRLVWNGCLILYIFGGLPAIAREHRIPLEQTRIDGVELGVQPGDVLLIEPGRRPFLRIERVIGSAEACVTVRNNGGEVVLSNTDHYYDIFVGHSRYIRITGSGDAQHRYGFHLDGTNAGGSAVIVSALTSDCEMDHLHIEHAGFAGILAKTDGAIGTFMDNVSIHDNYIHDVGGEGLYLGETKFPGQTLRGVEVWNNVIAHTGYEACQIANAPENVRVHNNVFYDAGLKQDLWQDRNFQITSQSTCEFSHNLVIGAHSCLVVMSGGRPKVFRQNYFAGTVTEAAVVCSDGTMPDAADNFVLMEENFFRDVQPVEPVLLFTGAKTVFRARENHWGGENKFIRFQPIIDLSKKVLLENNRREAVLEPRFVNEAAGDFRLVDGDFYKALGMGLIEPSH